MYDSRHEFIEIARKFTEADRVAELAEILERNDRGKGVRRDKAALSSGCKPHPAIRSSRKQPEQAWRRQNV
jgi:hypothetical protein